MNITANEGLGKVNLNVEQVVKRVIRHAGKASEQTMLEGKVWYCEANDLARFIADNSALTIDQAASVIAHLSPKVSWKKNKEAALDLVFNNKRTAGIMKAPYNRAVLASTASDPFSTFGKAAKKTRSFARNIAGDTVEVTVDVWIARAVGVTEDQLKWVGVYEGIAHAFRVAAKRLGMEPAQLQAVVWIVVRGSAA